MAEENNTSVRVRTTALVVWTAVGVLILIAAASWIVGRITPALVPFVIAAVVAFLLHVPVNYLERTGLSRAASVMLCFLIGFSLLLLAGIFLVPPIGRQIQAFSAAAPGYLTAAQRIVDDLQRQFTAVVIPNWVRTFVATAVNDVGRFATGIATGAGGILIAAGTGVAAAVIDVVLGLVIAFWLLKDLPIIRRELESIAGPRFEDDADVLVSTIDRVVGGYLKGATIASFVTATIATTGLAIIGVPYALVLGMFVFFLNYIPYAGPFISALIAGTVGLFVSPLTALLAVACVFGAQMITDNFVSPKVMSNQVNLHPTLVIFSLLVGGTLWGIPGMLFAIPTAAVIQGLFVYYYERRTRRQLATESGALFKTTACPPEDDRGAEGACDDESRGGD
jgi:predicted PurR-regulated permease PerM